MDSIEQAKRAFMDGIEAISTERYADAEQAFRASLDIVADRPSSWLNLAVALLKQKKLDEAEKACHACLRLDPRSSGAYLNLGLVHKLARRYDKALAALQKATEIEPDYPDNPYYMGLCLQALRRTGEALACFQKVLDIAPGHLDAMCATGNTLLDAKNRFAGIACLEKVLRIDERHAEGHLSLAHAYHAAGRYDEAVASFQQALACGHKDREKIEYSIAALTKTGTPKAPPKEYVAGLFDEYAENFESHLVNKLNYRPAILMEQMRPFLKVGTDMLDLGCGTGLMGPMLKPIAASLTGVDLSQGMLDVARQKGLYERLVCADVAEYLDGKTACCDVVVAADVFVYVGDLARVFERTAQALRGAGIFAFSVERHVGDGFFLNSSMRYSHSESYCRDLAERNGFEVLRFTTEFLRSEKDAPDGRILGLYFVLRKRATGG